MGAPAGSPAGRAPAPPEEERELVERARARDARAFGTLVERYGARAHALALRVLHSPADAEEVTQDAFVRAWHALPRFRGDAAFSTWLYRIVSRLAFDRASVLRTRRARETGIESSSDLSPQALAGPGGADLVQRRALESCVASLPEVQRAVITLFYFEDRSVRDVARTLDLNENTVKTHLARARATLRAAWVRRVGSEGEGR